MRRTKPDFYSVRYTFMSLLGLLAMIVVTIYFLLANDVAPGPHLHPTVTLCCRIAVFAYCFLVVAISAIVERRALKAWLEVLRRRKT